MSAQEGLVEQPCVKALLSYEQADHDGVMVLVSRQAIHETLETATQLESKLADRERQIVDAWNAFGPPSTRGGKICELYGDIDVLMLAGGADLAGNIVELEDQIAAKDAENARLLADNASLRSTITAIDKICHTPTPANMKADRHFQRDFDAIRKACAAALAGHEQAEPTMTAEQMREACAKIADGYDSDNAEDIASEIRALPASPGKGAE